MKSEQASLQAKNKIRVQKHTINKITKFKEIFHVIFGGFFAPKFEIAQALF